MNSLSVSIDLRLRAKEAKEASREGNIIIVIDVLRCCSTIVTALANGAAGVIPVASLSEARKLHRINPEYVLAGERGGIKPKDFDVGNSPRAFQSERFKDKYIILTTTDGTKAITLAKKAKTFIGSFLNVGKVAETVFKVANEEGRGVTVVLSGKKGRFSLEDFLCAGAIIEAMPREALKLSDLAQASLLAFRSVANKLDEVVRETEHGQYLRSLGFEADVEFCVQVNRFEVVPFLKGDVIVRQNF